MIILNAKTGQFLLFVQHQRLSINTILQFIDFKIKNMILQCVVWFCWLSLKNMKGWHVSMKKRVDLLTLYEKHEGLTCWLSLKNMKGWPVGSLWKTWRVECGLSMKNMKGWPVGSLWKTWRVDLLALCEKHEGLTCWLSMKNMKGWHVGSL